MHFSICVCFTQTPDLGAGIGVCSTVTLYYDESIGQYEQLQADNHGALVEQLRQRAKRFDYTRDPRLDGGVPASLALSDFDTVAGSEAARSSQRAAGID